MKQKQYVDCRLITNVVTRTQQVGAYNIFCTKLDFVKLNICVVMQLK